MRRRARDYASRASWAPGENISVVQRGGVKGSHTLNAAGMQMFGNCVSNLGRLPAKTLQELYNSLTGNKKYLTWPQLLLQPCWQGCTQKLRDSGMQL